MFPDTRSQSGQLSNVGFIKFLVHKRMKDPDLLCLLHHHHHHTPFLSLLPFFIFSVMLAPSAGERIKAQGSHVLCCLALNSI